MISASKKIELALRKKGKALAQAVQRRTLESAKANERLRAEIDQRKRTEEALRISEEKFRQFFKNTPDYCYIISTEGDILHINEAALKILGYKREELVGKPLARICAPESLAKMEDLFIQWKENGQIRDEEMVILTRKGEKRVVILNVGAVKDEDGTILHSTSVQTDITERKLTEDALNASENKYRAIVEMTGTGYLIIDLQGRVLDANQEYVRISGHGEVREIIGRNVIEWTSEKAKQRNAEAVAQCARDGFIRNFVTEYTDGSGKTTYVEINATVDGEGASARIISICRDISKLKLAESERVQLRHELAHLSRVLTMNELSASLAHEINQPLGAILNNASAATLLMSQTKDKHKEISEILEDIVQDAMRAGDVVRKIRGIVKKDEMEFEPLHMNTVIEDVVELFQNSIIINNVSLRLDLKPDLAKVWGDRVRLQQVLLNLITNALEAMKGRSPSILTIRSTMPESDMVIVSVSDSGTGIDEAKKEQVFEPFFSTKKDGLGMGLRICRSIIEEHDGRIWAENNPDGGATFSFSLKAWRGESA